ncbi:MAG: hypothetical protein ABL962_15320 [Fimbriimonadaceae bacterium]
MLYWLCLPVLVSSPICPTTIPKAIVQFVWRHRLNGDAHLPPRHHAFDKAAGIRLYSWRDKYESLDTVL